MNDKDELQRLLGLLGEIGATLPADAAAREALTKAMLALLFIWAEGRRAELESTYSEIGGTAPLNAEQLQFSMTDPETWVGALATFPDLEEQLRSQTFVEGTFGAFLKSAMEEVRKRRESPNVSTFTPKHRGPAAPDKNA